MLYLYMSIALDNHPSKLDQFFFFGESSINRATNWVYNLFKKIKSTIITNMFVSVGAFILTLILVPVLLIVLVLSIVIGLPIATVTFWNLARKLEKIKLEQLKSIQEFSFEQVKELEEDADIFLRKSMPLEKDMGKLKNVLIFKPLAKHYISILGTFKQFKQECIKRYTYSQEDTGLNDKEFEEYNAVFKSFSDIWDYPSSKKEQELVFNHKKTNS